jgi:hypothetical protein
LAGDAELWDFTGGSDESVRVGNAINGPDIIEEYPRLLCFCFAILRVFAFAFLHDHFASFRVHYEPTEFTQHQYSNQPVIYTVKHSSALHAHNNNFGTNLRRQKASNVFKYSIDKISKKYRGPCTHCSPKSVKALENQSSIHVTSHTASPAFLVPATTARAMTRSFSARASWVFFVFDFGLSTMFLDVRCDSVAFEFWFWTRRLLPH